MTPGKDARRQHGQNPAARTENGAIWCKLRPKSILAEAHFWPQGSPGPWLGYDMASSGLWGDLGVHFPRFGDPFSEQMFRNVWRVVQNQASRNSLPGLSEFIRGSRGSSQNGPRPAVQTPRFFTPGARMTVAKQTPSNEGIPGNTPLALVKKILFLSESTLVFLFINWTEFGSKRAQCGP